jgi:hypothetical protein
MSNLSKYIGQRFGKLTVTGISLISKDKVHCLCDCGNTKDISVYSLGYGATVSCGCHRREACRVACMNRTFKLIPQQREKIVSLYQKGKTSIELGNMFGINSSSVRDILKSRNVQIRPQRENNRKCFLNQAALSTLNETSLYWLGFLMTDGAISIRKHPKWEYHRYSIALALQRRDHCHIEKFKKFLSSSHKITQVKGKYPESRIAVDSIQLVNDYIRYGGNPNDNSKNNPISELTSSRDFWRGVIDGDGYIAISKDKWKRNRLEYVGTERMCQNFLDFLRTSQFQTNATVKPHKSIFRVGLCGKLVKPICDLLYDHSLISLDRKFATYQQMI